MKLSIHLEFHAMKESDMGCTPYCCGEPMEYTCDGKEGMATFNGYMYVENHAPPYLEDESLNSWERPRRYSQWLPKRMFLFIRREETELSTDYYRVVEINTYIIEIYKIIIHEITDVYSPVEDQDGTLINVCFFPTRKQTIYFRVLDVLKSESSTSEEEEASVLRCEV